MEGQSRGEATCIVQNLGKSSTEGGTRWITQRREVLFTNFLFAFLFSKSSRKERVFLRDRHTGLPMQNGCMAGVCTQDVSTIVGDEAPAGVFASSCTFTWRFLLYMAYSRMSALKADGVLN